MTPPEQHESQNIQAGWQQVDFVPGNPPAHPHMEPEVRSNHGPEQGGHNEDIPYPSTGSQKRDTDLGSTGSPVIDIQFEVNGSESVMCHRPDTQRPGLEQENLVSRVTDTRDVDIQFGTQASGTSTPVGLLSPASEKLLQNANTNVSIIAPATSSPFIQPFSRPKDIVEDIGSSFKYARIGSASYPGKTTSSKTDPKSSDIPKPPPAIESMSRTAQLKDNPSLPSRSAGNKNHNEASDSYQPLISLGASVPGDNHRLRVLSHSPQDSQATVNETRDESYQAPTYQEESIATGRVAMEYHSQDIAPTKFLPDHPFVVLPAEDTRNSPSVALLEQSLARMNCRISRDPQDIAIPDRISRSSRGPQRSGSSSIRRIKQPFPEVAKTRTNFSQHDTPVLYPDHNQRGNHTQQSNTVLDLPFFDAASNKAQSMTELSRDEDTTLHVKTVAEGQDNLNLRSPTGGSLKQSFTPSTEPLREVGDSSLSDEIPLSNADPNSNKEPVKTNEATNDCAPCEVVPDVQEIERGDHNKEIIYITRSQQKEQLGLSRIDGTIAVDHVDARGTHSDSQDAITESSVQMQPGSWPPMFHSRPQSRDRNHKKNNPAEGAHFRQHSESSALQFINNTKVKKLKFGQNQREQGRKPNSSPIQKSQGLSKAAETYQNFLKYGREFEDMLKDYQSSKEIVESQKSELEKLKTSNAESLQQIRDLKEEKVILTRKIKRIEQLAANYKDHMNGVVEMQKKLRKDYQQIQKAETDVKIIQEAHVTREAHIKRLEYLLQEVKEFRAPAEKLLAVQKANGELLKMVEDSSRNQELLQNDLDRRVIELGRERHNAEQLQKQLDAQNEARKELLELLKSTKSGIIDELTKDGGLLARILNSGNSTRVKVDELSSLFSTMKSHAQDIQPTLANLIENLYTRIEIKLQSADDNDAFLRESDLKIFEDMKERLNQFCLDQEARGQLNDRIADLREANAGLSADLSSRKAESEGMVTQIVELKSELASFRTQLSTKSDELAAALAIPRDDPELKGKLHDLGSANTVLQSQVDIATQEAATAKEELHSLRETSFRTEKQLRELENRLSDAQNSIETLAEEKEKYLANSKLDVEKARQDVAKAANAAKSEMIMRHESLVKNLEQRRTEAETQMKLMREELRGLQDERASHINRASNIQAELSTFKEKCNNQSDQINHLEMRRITREEFERQEASLESTRSEITELRMLLEDVQNDTTQHLSAALQTPKEIRNHLDDLMRENETLKEQNVSLQKKYDALSEPSTRLTGGKTFPGQHDEQAVILQTSRGTGPPDWDSEQSFSDYFNLEGIYTTFMDNQIPRLHHPEPPHEVPENGPDGRFSTAVITGPGQTPVTLNAAGAANPTSSTTRASKTSSTDVAAVDQLGYESNVPSRRQLLLKPLKVANRKASNPAQQSNSRERVSKYNFQQSTLTRTSHTTEETTIKIRTPTNEIIPFSSFTPIELYSSSSLTDVSPVINQLESLNSQEGLRKAYAVNRSKKRSGSRIEIINAAKNSALQTCPANTVSGLVRNQDAPSCQFSDEDNAWVDVTRQTTETTSVAGDSQKEPMPRKRPVFRKGLMPLKSALKKPDPKKVSNTSNVLGDPAYNPSTTAKPAPLLHGVPSGRGVNKKSMTRPEVRYNRVVSGQAPKYSDGKAPSGKFCGQTAAQHPSQAQQISHYSQKSPLMPVPKRNDRKRVASPSLEDGECPKPTKAPRLSLFPKISKSVIPNSQAVIPDSQEFIVERYHY